MNKHAKTQSFWKGKGFYIALALITAGAALASFLAINAMLGSLGKGSVSSTPAPLDGEEDITWGLPDINAETKQDSVPVTPSSSSTSQNTASSGSVSQNASLQQKEPAAWQVAQTQSWLSPVNGEVLAAFSGDELVFNETMKDWRTHNGMDVKADINPNVRAPKNGTVKKIETDAMWGGVVELECDGLTIRLCGVKPVQIKAGDIVKQGQNIGVAAEIPAETKLPVHVHIECIKNENNVDPAKYFS